MYNTHNGTLSFYKWYRNIHYCINRLINFVFRLYTLKHSFTDNNIISNFERRQIVYAYAHIYTTG